nr:response regulator [Actinomycetota bacterium]
APFRSLARRLLESDGFSVVGEAADGASALASAAELRPDLVLLDVQLPDVNGCDIARLLAERAGSRVVLVSSREASTFGRRLGESGAVGFIAKDGLSGAAVRALLLDGS